MTAQLRSQRGFPCTCVEHPGRTSASFPENPFSASFSSTFRDVLRVVPDTVNREYSGGFANAHLALSGQLVVDISGKRVDVRDILDVLLAVEYRLVEVRNTLALGNIEPTKPIIYCTFPEKKPHASK